MRRYVELKMSSGLRAFMIRRDGLLAAVNEVLVEGVLEGAPSIARVQPPAVGLVLGQQPLHAVRIAAAGVAVISAHAFALRDESVDVEAHLRLVPATLPAPGVAEHELRQQVQRRSIGAAIVC